jgi:hypothetical protein
MEHSLLESLSNYKKSLSNETLLLRVPSVVIEHKFNMLINLSHSEIRYFIISNIKKYQMDERLLRRN